VKMRDSSWAMSKWFALARSWQFFPEYVQEISLVLWFFLHKVVSHLMWSGAFHGVST